MPEINKAFRDLEVGDEVFNALVGWEAITKIDKLTSPGTVYVWTHNRHDGMCNIMANHGDPAKVREAEKVVTLFVADTYAEDGVVLTLQRADVSGVRQLFASALRVGQGRLIFFQVDNHQHVVDLVEVLRNVQGWTLMSEASIPTVESVR